MQHKLAISNGFMAKNSGTRMMPDIRDFTKPSISLLEMEEDYYTYTTKETVDTKEIADTRQTAEDNRIAEIEDASLPLKVATIWTSMPYKDQTCLTLRKMNIWQQTNAFIVPYQDIVPKIVARNKQTKPETKGEPPQLTQELPNHPYLKCLDKTLATS